MKRAILAATALLSSTIMSTPAFGDTIPSPTPDAANGTTLAAMQTQCDALALVHGPATGQNDHFTGEVVEGDVTLVAGPTEVAGSRVVDESSIQGIGTFVPSVREIRGNPFRTGGSVNLFGDQWATAGYYPDSTYNFSADFTSTFAHAFSCNIYQEVYTAAHTEHHNAVGVYVVYGDFGESEDAIRGNCAAFTAQGDDNPQPSWFGDLYHGGNTDPNSNGFGPHCQFQGTQASDEQIPEDWADPVLISTEPGTAVNQDQTDSLDAFEDHGGPVQVTGEYHIGQTVICISPGPKGGSWRAQNGYSGGSFTGAGSPPAPGCNTKYFKVAPWGNGSQTSNGTWTSVPDYNLP